MNPEKMFSYLGKDLLHEMLSCSALKFFPKNADLIHPDQYVKVVPVVISGIIKVMIRFEDKDLLLYYIQPAESCIMSFSACLTGNKSKIFATTEEDSEVLLIPSDKLKRWVKEFPMINQLFYRQYDLRYAEMIDTLSKLLFDKLDKRIYDYLLEKAEIIRKNP